MATAQRKSKPASSPKSSDKWSQHVTETSNAMTLQKNVFTFDDPKKIALSLKRSAERSNRRKSDPYRSAMSMLTLLHQPRRQQFARGAPTHTREGEGRVARSFRQSGLSAARAQRRATA